MASAPKPLFTRALYFAVTPLLIAGAMVTLAQVPEAATEIKDRAVVADQARQDAQIDANAEIAQMAADATEVGVAEIVQNNTTAAAVAQTIAKSNAEEIKQIKEEMSGDQKFWIQILTLFTGMITAIVAPIIALQMYRAQYDRKQLAMSINGVKDELVNKTYAAGYFEGVTMAKTAQDSPEIIERYNQRAAEVSSDLYAPRDKP